MHAAAAPEGSAIKDVNPIGASMIQMQVTEHGDLDGCNQHQHACELTCEALACTC